MVQLQVSRVFQILHLGKNIHLWHIRHVSLNATKPFQVVFEVRKGSGGSSGGFSIDDINLSETRCPDFTMQLDHFESLVQNTTFNTAVYSPRLYSPGGYSYRVGILLQISHFGLFVQMLAGENDDGLEWPLPQRQVTFTMMDQTSNIQQHMSKQRSSTSDLSLSTTNGKKCEQSFVHLVAHLPLMFSYIVRT